MYKEIEQVKAFEEIEEILHKHSDVFGEIGYGLKPPEYKSTVKKLGARYLIKDSILSYLGLDGEFGNIEIENEENGKPKVSFKGIVEEKINQKKIMNVQVSISHSRNYVATLVIIE